MKKEDMTLLAQLLTGMKDAVDKLSNAYNKNDMEALSNGKREILNLHKEIDKLL